MDVCPGDNFLPVWLKIETQNTNKKNAALESRPGSQGAPISLGTTAADETQRLPRNGAERNADAIGGGAD
jgi:hypothetical protein